MVSVVELAPSLLSADLSCLRDEVQTVQKSGADRLHLDIMDGLFVPNLTFGPPILDAIRPHTTLPIEAHLMVRSTPLLIEDCAKAGANVILIHPERELHCQRHLTRIRQLGCKAGVVLNPDTPLAVIEYLLPDIDQLLIMTVNPGFGGQVFIPQMLDKIQQAAALIKSYPITLEADGGITGDNIHKVVQAGAHVVVAGTAVFKNRQISDNIDDLKQKAMG